MNKELFRKPNPKNADILKDYISKTRSEIEETLDVISIKESEKWSKLKKILERKLASIEVDLDSHERYDEVYLRRLLQQRLDQRLFISLIDDGEVALNNLNSKLEKAQRELDDLEQRYG